MFCGGTTSCPFCTVGLLINAAWGRAFLEKGVSWIVPALAVACEKQYQKISVLRHKAVPNRRSNAEMDNVAHSRRDRVVVNSVPVRLPHAIAVFPFAAL